MKNGMHRTKITEAQLSSMGSMDISNLNDVPHLMAPIPDRAIDDSFSI